MIHSKWKPSLLGSWHGVCAGHRHFVFCPSEPVLSYETRSDTEQALEAQPSLAICEAFELLGKGKKIALKASHCSFIVSLLCTSGGTGRPGQL